MPTSKIRYMALAAIAAMAFAACSSSSKPASSTTTTSSPTSTSTAATSAPTSSAPASSTPTSGAAGATTVRTAASSLGVILVDSQGLPLYTYGGDTAGTSNCTGSCASVWPPVAVTGTPTFATGLTASKFSTITRTDGTKQLTLNGMPLYTFASDQPGAAPGGNNVNTFKVALASAA
jgi:predicted lipoprotein with Yx(FWY)xxD motif